MAKQVLNKSTPSNRVDHVDQRNKINANFTEIYEGKVDKETGKSLVSTAEKANWNAKQDPLTLKTVNGESIVGTGNIVISGGGGNVDSVNGVLPDGSKNVALTTDNIPQTSEKQYVSTTEKSNWNSASIGSDLGLLKTTDTPPPTGTHKGDVNSAGTYTNFKTASAVSIVFTAPELVDNFGYIYVVDNVATKSLVAKKGGSGDAPYIDLSSVNKKFDYTLETAILEVPVEQRKKGVVIRFNRSEEFQFMGTYSEANWLKLYMWLRPSNPLAEGALNLFSPKMIYKGFAFTSSNAVAYHPENICLIIPVQRQYVDGVEQKMNITYPIVSLGISQTVGLKEDS